MDRLRAVTRLPWALCARPAPEPSAGRSDPAATAPEPAPVGVPWARRAEVLSGLQAARRALVDAENAVQVGRDLPLHVDSALLDARDLLELYSYLRCRAAQHRG